jgi:hypothetical protein
LKVRGELLKEGAARLVLLSLGRLFIGKGVGRAAFEEGVVLCPPLRIREDVVCVGDSLLEVSGYPS